MAMTALERKRLSLHRKKERERFTGDATDGITSKPFNEYLPEDGNWNEVLTYLEWAGIKPRALPSFETDLDPNHDPENDGPYRGSIGRAERMVGSFLDAAVTLAGIINRYKCREIDVYTDKLEATLSSAGEADRKNIIAEIVRLSRLRDRLNRQVRWTLPEWKLKGD